MLRLEMTMNSFVTRGRGGEGRGGEGRGGEGGGGEGGREGERREGERREGKEGGEGGRGILFNIDIIQIQCSH